MKDTFDHIFKNCPNAIVLGDYNLDNEQEYTKNITNFGFNDVILKF